MKMGKMKCLCVMVALLAIGFTVPGQAADYPMKDFSGIIQWGAGGALDNVSRGLTPIVEKHLGKQIVLQNKPGASGAVAVMQVYNQTADGYTLLYAAENAGIYKVLGVSEIDFKEFYPVTLIARGLGLVVCGANQPWKTIEELFADAKKNPGQIKMGQTGPGGMPNVVGSMFRATSGLTFNEITFPGDGPVIAALLGGHVQFSVMAVAAAIEHCRAGRLRLLATISDVPVTLAGLEKVPLITSVSADYKKYLPWGPFYGVHVKKETPDAAKKVLVAAFKKGLEDPQSQAFLRNFGSIYMGISGAEAEQFINKWTSVTSWLLQDAGAAKISPDKFGIPRP
jgi:tripartite-type tricarboxylate transporter receptor subunit TctC